MYPTETSLYHAILTGAFVLVILVVIFVITILYYQKRKLALHKTMIRSEMNALEKERARIAGDLHDDLGTSLSAIKLKLQCLNVDDEKEKLLVCQSENYIDEAMMKLKRISFNMMPRVLERKGLKQALHEFIDTIQQTAAITINFRYACPELGSEETVHIYRIIQEVLTNMVKHSGAATALVELKTGKGKIIVHMADNGKGFNKSAVIKNTAGQGLQNILARADVLNAKIYLTTTPGCGVNYLIQIPRNT
jgi:two-component system NarL family sensor kinase